MREAVMTKRDARIIGLIYLLFFLTSILSDGFLKGLVVQNDASATATRILTHESSFRLGVATGLVETGFYVALTALFYDLFKPVNRRLSLVAAFFGLIGCAVQAAGSAFQLFSLVVLGGGHPAAPFTNEQLSAFSLLFFKLNDQAAHNCRPITTAGTICTSTTRETLPRGTRFPSRCGKAIKPMASRLNSLHY